MISTPTVPVPAGSAGAPQRGKLAQAFQEVLTAAVRLRARRQAVADAALFRSQVKQLLAAADQEARQSGYSGEAVNLAVYACTAFLDETVLNSGEPVFASWPRQSLQEEVFGDHNAGETFFAHLTEVVRRQDSEEVADVLEVYLLCLLLGFRGRYSAGGGADGSIAAASAKVDRIRGGRTPLAPRGDLPPDEKVVPPRDPWTKRLALVAATAAGGAAALFVSFWLSLHAQVGEVRELVARLIQ